MARITVCDHRDMRDLDSFRIILQDVHGHEVEIVGDPDPLAAFGAIKRLNPDGIHMDLMFEGIDNDKPPNDWWGCQIIRLLRGDPVTCNTPIVARSRFLTEDVRRVVENLGIPRNLIVGQFEMNVGEVGALLDSLV